MFKIQLLRKCSELGRCLARCNSVTVPERERPAFGNRDSERSFPRGGGGNKLRRSGEVKFKDRGLRERDASFPWNGKPRKSLDTQGRRTRFPVKKQHVQDETYFGQVSSGRGGGPSDQLEGSTDEGKQWVKSVFRMRQERYSRQVLNLVRKVKVSEAARVLDKMKKGRLGPDVVVYNNIILGYGREGEYKLAFKTFNELKKRGLLPTDYTYSSMFAACGSAGPPALDVLNKVRSEMERRDVPFNTITANSLMSALALCGKHAEAIEIYMDMEKMNIRPDIYTYGGLLVTMAKDRKSGVGVAQGVWSEMTKSAIVPDLHCHNMVLQVLRDGGMEGVVKEVEHIPDKPPKTLELPYISADELKKLVGQVKIGKSTVVKVTRPTEGRRTKIIEEGKRLKKGNKRGVENVVLMGGDVSGEKESYERDGTDAGAMRDSMNKEKIPLEELSEKTEIYVKGDVTFELSRAHRMVLKVGSGRPNATQGKVRWLEKSSLEAFFAYMKKNRVKPDIHTFHLLGHLTPDYTHLLVTMQERKVSPDAKFMVAMVTQHSRHFHNLQGALALMGYCKEVGLNLGQAGYQALAAGCTKEKDAMTMLDMMKVDGVQPNHQVMGTLIGHAVRDHSYEYLTALIRMMMHQEMTPNDTIIQMLDTAAYREPKSERQNKRLNGFKGFYRIWKNKVCPEKKEEEYTVV